MTNVFSVVAKVNILIFLLQKCANFFSKNVSVFAIFHY